MLLCFGSTISYPWCGSPDLPRQEGDGRPPTLLLWGSAFSLSGHFPAYKQESQGECGWEWMSSDPVQHLP